MPPTPPPSLGVPADRQSIVGPLASGPSLHARPSRLAPRVWLHDAADAAPDGPPGTIALPVRPSAAFGDGSHPSTRLAARAVDLCCRQRLPAAVLDVGTGTGVLARLARAHGVPFVVGTDNDPAALAAARVNVALDTFTGELILEDRPPDTWGPRFDLVVANILEGILLSLADPLVAAVAPGGRLLLAGFTPLQTPSLRAAFTARGLTLTTQATLEGWAILELVRG